MIIPCTLCPSCVFWDQPSLRSLSWPQLHWIKVMSGIQIGDSGAFRINVDDFENAMSPQLRCSSVVTTYE